MSNSVTPWNIQSMEFSRPQNWRELTFPFLEDPPDPGIEPRSPILQADSLPAEPQVRKRKINIVYNAYIWNLERWYQRIYLQASSGETDIENRLMGMGRGEERVRCMERITWKLILPYVK